MRAWMKPFHLLTVFALLGAISASAEPTPASDLKEWNYGDLTAEDAYSDIIRDASSLRVTSAAALAKHEGRRVQIVVHKSMKERGYQYLTVTVDGSPQFEAPVSTAWERMAPAKTGAYRASTPPGKFIPDSLEPKRFSNKWQVWLKYVIRFNSGIWIHATTPDHYLELGAPASGGCVRLHPSDAKTLYEIVEKYGINETAITVLQHDADEPQLPWKLQPKKPVPASVESWRVLNDIK